MKKWMQEFVRYATLTAVTLLAFGVMVWLSMRNDSAAQHAKKQVTSGVSVVAQAKPLVAVETVEASLHEITLKFSGKIRPWETYSIAFELGGRLSELGLDDRGHPLDDGSRVTAGQLLGRLDDRILLAQRSEAAAQFEQESADLHRARDLRDKGLGAITASEFQEALTQLALAKARLEIATKNLEDATLIAPVDATVARRLVEPGESVSPHQTVFELVQNQEVLLVIDVPESKIRELQHRMRVVRRSRADLNNHRSETALFRARVHLESHDRFGQSFPPIDAEVYRIAEVADSRTGLFEVEIRISNEDRLLRPGMVATAELVVDRISAYRISNMAALFRNQQAYVFTLGVRPEPLTVMFWDLPNIDVAIAKKVVLSRWIDQGDHLLIPSTSIDLKQVVVRGQQRLADGQYVRVVDLEKGTSGISNKIPAQPQGPTPQGPTPEVATNSLPSTAESPSVE